MSPESVSRRLMIVTSIHPDFDKRVWRHARSIARLGWRVEVVCPWRVQAGSSVDGVHFFPFPPVRGRLARPFLVPWRVFRVMMRAVRRADVVHFHDLDILPWMSVVSFFKPVVYDVHENYPDEMLVREWIPRALRQPLYFLVKWGQKGFSRIIGNVVLVTEAQRPDFPATGVRVAYVKNFASEDLVQMAADDYASRPDRVLFTGSHYALNGSWLLLDIAECVKSCNSEVQFVVADRFSNRRMREEWQKAVRQRRLEGTVQLVSGVAPPEIMTLLNQGTIGINPVLRVDKQSKAINTKLFEFMAAGIPFVSSDLEFPSQLVRETGAGLLARPESPKSFARAIMDLVEDRNAAEEMGRRGRQAFLEDFTWESQMPRLCEFYEELLRSR